MNKIIQDTLNRIKIDALNEMQQAVLNADQRKDLMLLSPTGTGKTLAFLLPLLSVLRPNELRVQALIVAPSRELALQIESVFRSLATGSKVVCCYGGHPLRTEKKSLEVAPSVIIATPGRLVDHIERENVNIDTVHTLILDEFDKSLELGFTDEMKEILSHLPALKRRVLTSATSAIDIPNYIGMKSPVKLSFLKEIEIKDRVSLRLVHSPIKDKLETLYKLLGELNGESTLVFCNLRAAVERVCDFLSDQGVDNECFHGGMEQPERERALIRFRNGSSNIFVCTDLAARGLDIPDVKNVIHYHLPINQEGYTHRNGRTARMNATGNVFMILNEIEEVPEYVDLSIEDFYLSKEEKKPKRAEWKTLTINRGKRDKISKMDVVGFLHHNTDLEKDDLGIIEIKESCSYAAIKREKLSSILPQLKNKKIKNKNIKLN